jgi:hypothetical protein
MSAGRHPGTPDGASVACAIREGSVGLARREWHASHGSGVPVAAAVSRDRDFAKLPCQSRTQSPITPGLLYCWRRALAQAPDLADAGQAVVSVQIAGPATSSQVSRIEIVLVNGVRLLAEETVDPVRLGRLVAALEQR